jgi:hypothetical protein
MLKQVWEWIRQSLFVSRDSDELQKQFARMSTELDEHSQLLRAFWPKCATSANFASEIRKF